MKKSAEGEKRVLQTVSSGGVSAGSRAGYPNEMEWDYKVIQKEHEKILKLRKEQTSASHQAGPVAGAGVRGS